MLSEVFLCRLLVTEVPSFEILHIYCKRVQCKTFLTLQKVHFQLWQMEAVETTSVTTNFFFFFLKNDCLYQLLLTSSMDDAELYLMKDNKAFSPYKKM